MALDTEGLYERIRSAMRGENPSELARKLNLTPQSVYLWQKGKLPSLDKLDEISTVSNTSIHWLLTGEGPQSVESAERNQASLGVLDQTEVEAVRELARDAGENYETMLRRMVRNGLRAIGRLPPATEPLNVDYYGAEWTEVPLLGTIAAGSPIEVFDLQETARVIKTWPKSKKAYALRVAGDSMVEAGIQDGDLIVCVEASEARRGQLVVALIDGDTATVKRYYRENGNVILLPANAAYQPQRYDARRVTIQGQVESIVHAPKASA